MFSAVPSPEVSKDHVTFISAHDIRTTIRQRADTLSRCGCRLRCTSDHAQSLAVATVRLAHPSALFPRQARLTRVSAARCQKHEMQSRLCRASYGPHPPPPWFDFGRSLNDLMLLPRVALPLPLPGGGGGEVVRLTHEWRLVTLTDSVLNNKITNKMPTHPYCCRRCLIRLKWVQE